uniref:Uncharacterized protein n=1 Tax=Nelumbo nucifera TaxID=4432 RepID=A0A822XRH1_NELNU|nr:TPA_asm: hypothetical protein HUJ06_023702 [Nelumbo nucifera]DAD22241.1 TPA_asm: hypothetical protein HUJ06_023705 [Nelumbo nucifera]DAD22243.1 TPA_asm: hypothetical protein HUJ06_023706 [Nelumbo nucifera]DAD22248.1 TPA_asm: hypothetical protein HUJ06_023711 [Nelumbo nucifera]DAD22249.1 TPA_asm: hypothetical protein HUJ06_023712 [Nelumbo nucifera]
MPSRGGLFGEGGNNHLRIIKMQQGLCVLICTASFNELRKM